MLRYSAKRLNHKEKLLQSLRNKFVYSTADMIVHDRTCTGVVKAIPNKFFAMLEELPEPGAGMELAPCCRRVMLIREGMAQDCPQVNMQILLDFFSDMRATDDLLRELFCDYRAKFWYEDQNTYFFWVKEDMWQIKRLTGKKLELWHNSYYVNKKTLTRFFFNGEFHLQVDSTNNPSFELLCRRMMQYKPQYHVDQTALKQMMERFNLDHQAYLHHILTGTTGSGKSGDAPKPEYVENAQKPYLIVKHWEPKPGTELRPRFAEEQKKQKKETSQKPRETKANIRDQDRKTLRQILGKQ